LCRKKRTQFADLELRGAEELVVGLAGEEFGLGAEPGIGAYAEDLIDCRACPRSARFSDPAVTFPRTCGNHVLSSHVQACVTTPNAGSGLTSSTAATTLV